MVALPFIPGIESEYIETRDFWAFMNAHFDGRRVRRFKELGSSLADIAKPLIEADSEVAFGRLLERQTEQLRNLYSKRQKEFDEILRPRDVARDVFVKELVERSSKIFWRIFDTHTDWLDERHQQLLTIALEDKESNELWMVERILPHRKLPRDLEAKIQHIEVNVQRSVLDNTAIGIIFAGDEYKTSLPLLVENLYGNVSIINFALFEQAPRSYMPEALNQQQDLDKMGYRKGRSEGESDEDVDAFLEDIRTLRGE